MKHICALLLKQGKKVCKTTAVQCYQCFSLRSLLFLASRAKWLIPNNNNSYSDELLTAADCCKTPLITDRQFSLDE